MSEKSDHFLNPKMFSSKPTKMMKTSCFAANVQVFQLVFMHCTILHGLISPWWPVVEPIGTSGIVAMFVVNLAAGKSFGQYVLGCFLTGATG